MNFKTLLFVLAFTTLVHLSFSQTNSCSVSNLTVQVANFNTQNCTVTFLVSFDQSTNKGNKTAYIHIWNETFYHSTGNWSMMYTRPNNTPKQPDLASALTTIVVNTSNTGVVSIGSTYFPDQNATPPVVVASSGLEVNKSILSEVDRVTISNIQLSIPNCTSLSSIKLKGDIWESQAASGTTVQCYSTGLAFAVNFPKITSAFKVCEPRSFTFAIQNNSSDGLGLGFNIYQDNGDGTFEGTITGPSNDPLVFQEPATSIAANGFLSRTQLQFPALQELGEQSSYWLQATAPSLSYTTLAFIDQNAAGCLALPVSLSRLSADRNAAIVKLQWQTEWEHNNKGFDIQRNEGGIWQSVGFVKSAATDGNSSAMLSYRFEDMNNNHGATQYRLVQQDLDGKSTFSATIVVAGYQSNTVVLLFPNPAPSGSVVKVSFDGTSQARSVLITDMQGRTIREWKTVTSSSLQIDKLQPGIYSLQVKNLSSGERTTERLLITQ